MTEKALLTLRRSIMFNPDINTAVFKEVEITLPDNYKYSEFNQALSKASGEKINFADFELDFLRDGNPIMTASYEYRLSKPKPQSDQAVQNDSTK